MQNNDSARLKMIAIQLYSGFLQPEQFSNGMSATRNRLVDKLTNQSHYLNYSTWTDSVVERAKLIREYIFANPLAKIYIAGHSFGGATAVQLAEALQPLKIETLYLLDAVHNSGCKYKVIGKLPHKRVIDVPNNVKFLYSWRQTEGIPRGSKVKIQFPTIWKVNEFVKVRHNKMDELTQFEAEIMREVYKVR